MIYLDNASTTKVYDSVIDGMNEMMRKDYYNPSALYGPSAHVKQRVQLARKIIARQLGCSEAEVFFTSCATESNNWAINSGFKNKKGNIVVTMGEHPSVYETAMELANKGMDVRFAKLLRDGSVDTSDLYSKIDKNTCLVSVMHCSNETGAVNDVKTIAEHIKELSPKCIVHCDGVQAFCKISTDVKDLGVDLYSLSAHKIGACKGIGALYICNGTHLNPFIFGGGQEKGLRSGTENTAGIIGFGQAVEACCQEKKPDVKAMREYLIQKLIMLPQVSINGNALLRSDYILSASIAGIKGEILQHMLSESGILIGLGSACSAKSKHNRILNAIGKTGKEIEGSIRISFCNQNTMEEMVHTAELLIGNIQLLRGKING